MGTTSDSIFYFSKPHVSKSKTCFEILVKKSFTWIKYKIKKMCQIPKKKCSKPPPGPHYQKFFSQIHGILFFLQIYVPGYMEFCFFFKSMYPGTWNFVSSSNPCTRVHERKIFSDNAVGVVWRIFFFGIWHFFLIFNLKILPIWFSQVSRCHMKDFFTRILKQVLLFEICGFRK